MYTPIKTTDFSAIRLKLASPEVIHNWSFGEVIKPETINYRTQRPEKDGLFCEKIFGPSKDWECYCGKYKKIRYKGITCDKCGVEVTRSVVRRERMGHIDLSVPVSHIWYLRNVPSKIGLILDVSIMNLEKVIYFASFIVTRLDEEGKKQAMEELKTEYQSKKKGIAAEYDQRLKRIEDQKENKELKAAETTKALKEAAEIRDNKMQELEELFSVSEKELKDLKLHQIISEELYQDLALKYGHLFEAGIGAEAIRDLLANIDLATKIADLEETLAKSKGAKRDKLIRRIYLIKSLHKNGIRPENMVLTAIPVIPPDLRPMVPLDGGRFATSDLNDLYRRVINRNNRLKQLLELRAPEVITRNEKRMLQEAVDALIDNGARHSKTVVASTGQRRMLKSMADMLKGKQGRFRQNLLGKRTDYSGRSVIVVGPHLKLHQCGLPKKMALELFKPFVISRLIREGYVHNVRSGSRFIEAGRSEVWDILEDIVKHAHVFLNRAPTLHRLGIQAFQPILIEGKAIQVHPLVCTAFNADFDGDQMAVHVPLSEEAKYEAANIMLSARNLLSPARGEPIATPSKDMVWGVYFMTHIPEVLQKVDSVKLSSAAEATIQYNLGYLSLHKKVTIPVDMKDERGVEVIETTVGRLMFNEILPEKIAFVNEELGSKDIRKIIGQIFREYTLEETAEFLDKIKEFGYHHVTLSGMSWGLDDVPELKNKPVILKEADEKVEETQQQYEMGLLTQSERYSKVIEIWTDAKERIIEESKKQMHPDGSVASMVNSGARGSLSQLIQIVGMKGLVNNPSGDIIELPIKGNFKEGIGVLEYFNSTHGARKGLADTALRTASSGYLTRRLVDVAQDVIVREKDCGSEEGLILTAKETHSMGKSWSDRVVGRHLAEDLKDGRKVIFKKGHLINEDDGKVIDKMDPEKVVIYGILNCRSRKGLCQKCYGWDLGNNQMVKMGTAVGIIAAQSIGEPGTQLTMRTFHTGGVAGSDITQGLPRVEEILEVRTPKHKAIIAEFDGKVKIVDMQDTSIASTKQPPNARRQKVVQLAHKAMEEDKYLYGKEKKGKVAAIKVKDGAKVSQGSLLFIDPSGNEVNAERGGAVTLKEDHLIISTECDKITEYPIPMGFKIWIQDGDLITKGTPLTEGSLDLGQYFKLRGEEAVQRYIIQEIQEIYSSQGQKLNDKHIEIMARQLFSRIYVKEPGDTDMLPGDVVEAGIFSRENEEAKIKGVDQAIGEKLILGISKVSLSTSSFLSAASFQETAKVLIQASLTGKVDSLEGLKENVIIGRLIPVGNGFDEEQHSTEALEQRSASTSGQS